MLLATAAAGLDSPANADCVAELNQQVPEGTRWHLHFDRVTNQRCWTLVDAKGREIHLTPPQPATTRPSSFPSFLGGFTGSGPPPPQQPPQQQVTTTPAPPLPRRLRVMTVNHQPVRPVEQKTASHPARPETRQETKPETRHEMSQPDRDALFEEFLRWHESRKITGTK
jgi:hypothetical protein